MKNSPSKSNFNNNSSNNQERLEKETRFSSKAVKSTMTEQLTIPPARVWDKIEKILDEQDNRRNSANNMIASSFEQPNYPKRRNVYLATVAGLTVIAGLMWVIL
ncbi:MAG: hypothetical protein JWR18_40 [Segetibacter sp.]|jgi:hypothetical protein|nr:hypothetical protein [Segetibacter sp.]